MLLKTALLAVACLLITPHRLADSTLLMPGNLFWVSIKSSLMMGLLPLLRTRARRSMNRARSIGCYGP